MKHQNIDVIENGIKITLNLGRQGEYNVRDIKFDMSDFQQKYGDGTATIVHFPANGSAYTVPSLSGESKDSAILDGESLIWTIGKLATRYDGNGIAIITWVTLDGLKKSIKYNTYCKESVGDYGAEKSAQQSYIDQMIELASTITDLSSEFSDAERIAVEIVDARENAVSDIETLKNDAVSAVNTAKSESIEDIGDSKESALDALNTAKQTALADIESAKQDAETDINAEILIAETHANNASQSATNASNSATNASNSADSADQSAASAQTSATNASNSAANASQYADNASLSANSASQSATSAQTSANNASTSEQNARQSAEDAQDILDSVQAEGNTQISRVQAKGDEIFNSLPEDFTQVQNDIASLNGSLGDVKADLGNNSHLETLDKTNIVSAINSLNRVVRTIANRDTSWAGIRENVKSGYGEILYPAGTDFSVSCPSGAPYNDIVFTVVNHRVENDEPIMTLLMKRCIFGIQFDAIQAAFVASEAMAAGTYHFKLLDGYDTSYDGGKYVQFIIVNPLVAGDQIVITWGYNQSWIGKNAYVYHAFDTTPTETCVMSEGQSGTYLGVADGSSANLNHTHRLRYGSNNWKESAVREWLNSDAQAGSWQTQQTKFQRPCSYASSKAGFMSYLDPSFVATVRTGTHLNSTNQVFDLLGTKVAYSTEERFFLLSNEEIGFSSESGIVCGSLFSFYDGANNDDRIKYDIANENTARYWWLRTPYPSTATDERIVSSSGALISGSANNGGGAAAACEI